MICIVNRLCSPISDHTIFKMHHQTKWDVCILVDKKINIFFINQISDIVGDQINNICFTNKT